MAITTGKGRSPWRQQSLRTAVRARAFAVTLSRARGLKGDPAACFGAGEAGICGDDAQPGRLVVLDRSTLNWRSRVLILEYAADVGEDWSGWVRLGLSAGRFGEADVVFLTRREERTRSVGLTLSHRKVSREGYQPVLMLDRSRTNSNVAQHDRKLLSFRAGLRRLF